MPSALLPRLLGHDWVQGQPTPLPLRSRAASLLAVRPPDLTAACVFLSYGAKGVPQADCVPSAWSALLIGACSAPIRFLLLRSVLPRALDKNQSDLLINLSTVYHADAHHTTRRGQMSPGGREPEGTTDHPTCPFAEFLRPGERKRRRAAVCSRSRSNSSRFFQRLEILLVRPLYLAALGIWFGSKLDVAVRGESKNKIHIR